MKIHPLLLTDGYKVGHKDMYPKGTELIYSNLTPRSNNYASTEKVVFFGLQAFVKKYMLCIRLLAIWMERQSVQG